MLGLLLGLGGCASLPTDGTTVENAAAAQELDRPPVYETVTLPTATVHVVTIADPVAYPLRVAAVEPPALAVDLLAQQCQGRGCIAINAGFFDPQNGLTTSPVVIGGALVADPRQNPRLMGNPDLTTYLGAILNRSELRRYDCGGTPAYAIVRHRAPLPTGCALVDAVGAGPQLLPVDTAEAEGFVDRAGGRDALGSQTPNARSAVGLRADGGVVLAMVAQVPGVTPSGMTTAEVAAFLRDRGVVQALNLDGGSSATLVAQGTPHYGRLNSAGEWVQRPVKSILWVAGGR